MAHACAQEHGHPELAAWLRLAQTSGVGPETARRLLAAFGPPPQIFAASLASLQTVVTPRVAQALRQPPSAALLLLIEQTLAWAGEAGNHVLTLADADYPPSLLQIPDPPLVLYVKGRLPLLTRPALAVVGSRNATVQGALNAEQFAHAVSQAGYTVISGMALGIDAAAHRGALQASAEQPDAPDATGSTIAVIGTGADIVYPARNRALAHRIAEAGCIVSEYPLGMPAIAANFPRRNRIISGLARAVLVVEAAAQSGSLITARMAAEQGRDVLAIPGSIHAPLSKGCHQLIKQGAKLVESAQDVLEELQQLPFQQLPFSTPPVAVGEREAIPPAAAQLLDIMGFDPVTADLLAARCALDIAKLMAQLLTLELQGQIEVLPGGSYRRLA